MSETIELEKKHYEEIISYAKEEKIKGKTLASWGAGKRGSAFVARIDSKGDLLKCIFDKNEAKWGSSLPSGHKVEDFHKEINETDVVFLPMTSFVSEITELLIENGFSGDIVSVDDWLLGGVRLPLQKRLKRPMLKHVRKARIAALVVIYNPESLVAEHIASYADKVEKLYVWDNSPKGNRELFAGSAYDARVQYIHTGVNSGIGEPVNRVADLAKGSGMDWLLTFDQDSAVAKGVVEAMRAYVESDMLDKDVVVVAPIVEEPMTEEENGRKDYRPFLSYVRSAITSGSMYRLDVLRQLRYRQEFFIDQLDHDFCIRAYLSGRKVVRLNHVSLHHQIDAGSFEMREAEGYRFYVRKYSPDRYYYQYRNLLYSIKDFAGIAPDYAISCQAGLRKLEMMAMLDSNETENARALQCAKEDFEAGVMGKWRGLI